MRIVVLGAGALGSIIAGHLARSGEDVVLLARGDRAERLKRHGVTITGLAEFNTPCAIATNPRDVVTADYLIVAVKTYQMESALADIAHLEVGSALSIQNGLMKNEQLAKVFGDDRTLGAAASFSGEVTQDAAVRFTVNRGFYVGELPDGTSDRVETLVTALNRAGIVAEADPQIRTIEWSKFAIWAGAMTLAVLMRLETAKILSDSDSTLVGSRVIRETASLAETLGVPLKDLPPWRVKTMASVSEQEAAEAIREVGTWYVSNSPSHRLSSLQDLERGQRLEVEETLGYAVSKAREEHVQVPTLETCYHLISGINRMLQA